MDKRTRTIVTIGIAVGLLAGALDQTIVDTAFPRMISDLGGVAIFTWVITAYLLASTAVVPVVGKLADMFGRKIFFLIGLAVFAAGSVLCGAAQNMTQLIAFRAFQGIGAGMLMPIAFTIVGDLYPGEERARIQGVFGGIWGLASIAGPKLGGWLTLNYSWRWVFYVNLPVCIAAFAIIMLGLQESRGERRPIDYWGSLTVTAGICLALLGLIQGGDAFAWGSWQQLSVFGVAAALLVAFALIERRAPEPVLNFGLFTNRTYAVMTAVSFLVGVGMFGVLVFVPWFIQGVVGVNPNVAGNVMTPMMITLVVFATLSGRLGARVPYRYFTGLGFALMGVGLAIASQWTVATTQLQATLTIMVVGAGMGFMMPLMTLAVQNAVSARFRGQVTSGVTFFRSMGATVGVSVFGVIFNNQMSARFATNLGALFAQAQRQLAGVPQATAALQQLAAKPQGLVQVLLQPTIRAQVPAPLLAPLTAGIKAMMVESLHTVFVFGVVLVVVGFVVGQLIGDASMQRQLQALEERGEAPAAAEPVFAE